MDIVTMDEKCLRIAKTQKEIAELEEQIEAKKATIKEIKYEVEQYFIETKRDAPYPSPYGTLYLREDTAILQPKGEKLREVFEHFRRNFGEEIAWQKLTINNNLLKSEVKQHILAVEERGGDPILEPFPGVEPPKTIKTLQFRKTKGSNNV